MWSRTARSDHADSLSNVLQHLMICVRHHLFHPLHVLGLGLDQPLHILLRGRLNGPRPLAEMTPKPTTKGQESPTHPGPQAALLRSHGCVFLLPLEKPLYRVTSSTLPCDQNQIMLIL